MCAYTPHFEDRSDAGGPPHVPVSLFEDGVTPQNSIKCYLGVSGCIGDVPFTAMVANACGHSAFKGCKFCFLVGQTINEKGEPLGIVRWGGCDRSATLPKAHKYDAEGAWDEVPVHFSAVGGTFDATMADSIKVTPGLHAMRVQSAQDVRAEARAQHPPPARPPNACSGSEALEAWQDGVPL